MNLQDQVIYRCIHAACARPLPRRVNFCPYCGTGQHDGVLNPAHVARPVQAAYVPDPQPEPARAAPPVTAPSPPPPPFAPPVQPKAVAPPPLATSKPRAAAAPASAPPRREPVRLRWWLVALGTLWLIWIYARPSTGKIEARIERATVASAECRLNDAQSELIALRMTRAKPEQLASLQAVINDAAATCGKKKLRAKAWDETVVAVESALTAGDFARAQSRLAQFTRKWDDDTETQRLKDKIAAQKAAAPPPPEPEPVASPSPAGLPIARPSAAAQQSQSVRNLINEAERALAIGNYKAASDKLETCITMVDAGNRECAAFKVHADRMQREYQRCLAEGRRWVADSCR